MESEATGVLLVSCVTPIAPGAVTNSESPKDMDAWRIVVEPLLASHPDRLTEPVVRRNGNLEEANREEALGSVASGLRQIGDESMADSIACLSPTKSTNEGNHLMQKFARAVVGLNNIDRCTHLLHSHRKDSPGLRNISWT